MATALLMALVTGPVAALPEDPKALENFIDGVWYSQKESHPAMGAVVTVVKDGEIWLNKGYGWADWDNRRRVDPEETLFRIASISKPFTWLAVMQLVEAGKLDLEADVNDYLSAFQIPATFPEPITMRHLMSHNAGFEDSFLDLGRRSADELEPLGEYLAKHLPKRVRPPGTFSSYSNHSTAIAAHVVEAISGLDWSSYIEERILAPLAMTRTAARHPMATELRAELASSYSFRAGAWRPQEFLHWFIYPAGMMSTTGSDMARFMLNQLSGGPPLMSETTHAQMLEAIYRPFPEANAWLHGYYEDRANGVRSYGHGGDLNGFHSQLALFPEENLGLFVAVNTDPAAAIRSNLVRSFRDAYFPEDPPLRPEPNADAAEGQAEYAGAYAGLRRSFTSFAKLVLLVGHTEIASNEDGYLTLSSEDGTRQYVALGNDRFGARYDHDELQFVRDDAGQVTHVHFSGFPASTMDRLPWHGDPGLHQLLLGLIALTALVTLIAVPIAGWQRLRGGSADRLPLALSGGAFVIAAGILINLFVLVDGLRSDVEDFYFELPASITASLTATLFLTVAIVLLVAATLVSFRRGHGSRGGRAALGGFCAVGLLYVWVSYYWNLLTLGSGLS
ncbi:MAG: serine hydrolase domain-containing protein [Pseudomonadota bacterium]